MTHVSSILQVLHLYTVSPFLNICVHTFVFVVFVCGFVSCEVRWSVSGDSVLWRGSGCGGRGWLDGSISEGGGGVETGRRVRGG